jgi:hypothetical protein
MATSDLDKKEATKTVLKLMSEKEPYTAEINGIKYKLTKGVGLGMLDVNIAESKEANDGQP